MKKLTKDQVTRKATLVLQLEFAKSTLDDAIMKYNAILEETEGFREEIASTQTDYYEERGDKWLHSDVGLAYSEWKEQWEASFNPIDELDIDHAERLADLPEELEA